MGLLSILLAALGLGLRWALPFRVYLLAPLAVVVERLTRTPGLARAPH